MQPWHQLQLYADCIQYPANEVSKCENHCSQTGWCSTIYAFNLTFGEDTLTWTIMGANEVLMSCAGWLMVSASSTTSCKDLASSKILSISLWTSATEGKRRAEQVWTRRNRKLITTPSLSRHLQDVHIIESNSSCSFTKAGAGVGSLNDGPLTGVV